MARKDFLSGALFSFRVIVETALGKSRCTIRAASAEAATEIVAEAFELKFPGVAYDIASVQKVQDRQPSEDDD